MIQGFKNYFVDFESFQQIIVPVHVRLSAGQEVDMDKRLGDTPTMP